MTQKEDAIRFSLMRYTNRLSPSLNLAKTSYFIPLNRDPPVPELCLYLTPNRYEWAAEATEAVAITYFPAYRYLIRFAEGSNGPILLSPPWRRLKAIGNFSLRTNEGMTVASGNDANKSPRVWPAFGHDGGAHEVLLVEPPAPEPKLSITPWDVFRLPDGGRSEHYVQDVAQAFTKNRIVKALKGFREILGGTEQKISSEGSRAKVNESGIAIAWKRGDRLYSLSFGYWVASREVFLRVWGYTWKDEGSLRLRRILGPLEMDMSLSRIPPRSWTLGHNPGLMLVKWSVALSQAGTSARKALTATIGRILSLANVDDVTFKQMARTAPLGLGEP